MPKTIPSTPIKWSGPQTQNSKTFPVHSQNWKSQAWNCKSWGSKIIWMGTKQNEYQNQGHHLRNRSVQGFFKY